MSTPSNAGTENELKEAARELSQMILSPLAAKLNKQKIIIVADDALNYVPFQVLPLPTVSDEPLIANHEIINAPSASTLGQLRLETARRQPATKTLAAFGDPVVTTNYAGRKDANTDTKQIAKQLETERLQHAVRDVELKGDAFDPSMLAPLFYAKLELTNLRDAASGGETFVAAQYDATREKLLNTDLTKYAILHFATHGLLDQKHPENSGLVLSTISRDGQAVNGFVGLQDIYNLHAPVDLVVLSACRTRLGKDVRGEGLLGLTRGFMYAGASSVVASLWKVDDEATAELMKRFYDNMLQKGMAPSVVLRAAQDSIRQQQRWRSPYYWAAFTLQGEYRQVIKPVSSEYTGRKRLYIIAGIILLIVLIGGGVILKRRHSRTVNSAAG